MEKPFLQMKRKHKKGKYLSPSQTKLNFKLVAVKTTANARATKKLDCSSKEFKTFERKVSSDICKKNKSFKTTKKEVKKMWKGLTNKERQNYSSTSPNKADHRNYGSSISSSTDSPKRSDALSDELVELVKTFYQRDDISRQAPGRKDVINVQDKNGQKVSYQTRHLTSSVMETYALFCKEYPNKIGKSKFAELRPKHVLLSSKLPHNVCLCKYHENFINAVNILHQVSPSVPLYTNEFPQSCLCNPVKRECWMNQCEQCKDGKGFRNSYPLEENGDIKWYVWKTDSSNKLVKNVEEGTAEELYTHICSIIPQFMAHCFTKRMQAEAYNKEQKDAEADSESLSNAAFLQVDFSENYTCVSQDEIQSAHWKQSQVSLFTAALWYSGILHPIVIASDNLNHSKDTIVAYIDYLLSILPSNTQNISIWSDGPSSQFKNRFIVAALKSLQDKHKIQITWNYFATSHGKGPVDGIGGAVKRQVWMTVKTRKHIVCDAKSFVVAAEDASNVKVVEMATSEIEERNTSLNTKECCVRMCESGARSGLYGMTNGNVRVLFLGVVFMSNCDWVYDEALLM
ncbi:Hypothetical predicted protein [Paramuricea clavata]|uniref:Uncharacterized protein n=1 Tax=Paramuricea clavata TaxID=317549 RepID=A0A7D9H9D8_PARCT|nr:Hypothetical predicted protein [Paramuricea clavata]